MIATIFVLLAAIPQEPLPGARAWDPAPSWEQTVVFIDAETNEPLADVDVRATDLYWARNGFSPGYWGKDFEEFLRARTWKRRTGIDGKALIPSTWMRLYAQSGTHMGLGAPPRHRFDPPLHVALHPLTSFTIHVRKASGDAVENVAIGVRNDSSSTSEWLQRTNPDGLAELRFPPAWHDRRDEPAGFQLLLPTAAQTWFSIKDPLHPSEQVEVTLPDGPPLEIRFEPPPQAKPPYLTQLRMYYSSGEAGGRILLGSTSGVFHLPLIDPGTRLSIVVEDLEERYHGDMEALIPWQAQDLIVVDVPMALTNFIFEGQLVAPDGNPLSNQRVGLDLHTTENQEESECNHYSIQTDEYGRFRIQTESWLDSYQGLYFFFDDSEDGYLRADFLDLHAPRPEYRDFGTVTLMPAR